MDPHIHASIPPAQIPAVTATATIFSTVEANNHVAPPPFARAPSPPAPAPVTNAFQAPPTAVSAPGQYTGLQANHPPYAEVIHGREKKILSFSL